MIINPKIKSAKERIDHLERAVVRAEEYLESGKHAKWEGFRPIFVSKVKDGEELPPHKDWIKNVFLPNAKRRLIHAVKALERLESCANRRSR